MTALNYLWSCSNFFNSGEILAVPGAAKCSIGFTKNTFKSGIRFLSDDQIISNIFDISREQIHGNRLLNRKHVAKLGCAF